MLDWIGERVDASFLKAVSDSDAYAEIAKVREAAGEILRIDDDELQVRSPIFAEYVIRNLTDSEDIVHYIFDVAVAAAARKKERKYRVIMGNLMQSSSLHQLLRDDEHKFNHMGWLYEKLRYHSLVNEEPLFWLQYMIFMMDTDNLRAAEEFMDTAYARAAANYGFKTFQIDTQAFRLLMLIESREKGVPVKRFDDIIGKLEIIAGMLSDESHRYHAIRVLAGAQPFIGARKNDLAIGEKNALVFWLSKCATALGGLAADIRAQTAADKIRASVLAAKEALLSP
jgi:hypothetical protein